MLAGDWTTANAEGLATALLDLSLKAAGQITLDASGLESLDTTGAWFLHALILRLGKKQGVQVRIISLDARHAPLYERVASLPQENELHAHHAKKLHFFWPITALGRAVSSIANDLHRGTGFLGEFIVTLPGRFIHPRQLRFRSIIFHVNEVGIKALPIIMLMAFSIAFVTGYQGAFQLRKFGAEVFTVDLIVLSTLREMGVLITAIMVAGRSGSAFAAQIGTMKLNEEVDALRTMGVSPFEALVSPRMLAIIVALPLLTIVADAMGLLGGYIFSVGYLDYSWGEFSSRARDAADMQQFFIGLVKAPVFALLIGIVGCMQGLRAGGSAEDVGRKTVTSVVQAIFLVIVADAVFSIIFTRMGI